MITTLTAPHPMAGQKMPTRFRVEQLNNDTFIIHDDKFNTGMSVTNNMECVIDEVMKWSQFGLDAHVLCNIYHLGEDGLFKIENYLDGSLRWIRMGDDDKALRVLYANT